MPVFEMCVYHNKNIATLITNNVHTKTRELTLALGVHVNRSYVIVGA